MHRVTETIHRLPVFVHPTSNEAHYDSWSFITLDMK